MQYAQECGLFSPQELTIINYCRLYLHVYTVSELFNSAGRRLLPNVLTCTREPWFNPGTFIALQILPSKYHIRTTWQLLCRQLSTSEGIIAESFRLGRWVLPGHRLRRRRQTDVIATTPPKIYHWVDGCYWIYRRTKTPGVYSRQQASNWEPLELCTPIDAVELSPDRLRIGRRPKSTNIPRAVPPLSFADHVRRLDPWEVHLLQGITFFRQPYEIRHLMQQSIPKGKGAYLVSDGSQLKDELRYGWVFGSDDGDKFAEHSGIGYGTPTSHRAEGWAMLSGILFFKHLLHYSASQTPPTEHQEFSLKIFSDNAGLIQRIKRRMEYTTPYPNSTLEADWDLVEQIYTLSIALPHVRVQYEWVQGHQDCTTTQLTIEAQYNIRADELAGTYRPTPDERQYPQWLLPVEQCRLVIEGTHIYGHYSTAIRDAAALPGLFHYLQQRHQWSKETCQSVDWEVMRRATKYPGIPQVQLIKLVHDKLPTRYEQAKSNPLCKANCDHCESAETFLHLVQCIKNPLAHQFRGDASFGRQSCCHTLQVAAHVHRVGDLRHRKAAHPEPPRG